MPDDFVRKEVFDARMDRMEALLEKTLTEMKMEVSAAVSGMRADNEKLRSEVNEKVGGIHQEIGGLRSEVNEKVDGLHQEIGGLRSEVNEKVDGLHQEISGLRSEVNEKVGGLHQEIGGLRAEVNEKFGGLHQEIGGLRAEIRVIDERVTSMNTRIDSVQTTVYWGFALMGLILAFTTFAPALADFIKNLRKPAVTMEDVERAIERAIAAAMGQSPQINMRS